jgi:hypothetical protein
VDALVLLTELRQLCAHCFGIDDAIQERDVTALRDRTHATLEHLADGRCRGFLARRLDADDAFLVIMIMVVILIRMGFVSIYCRLLSGRLIRGSLLLNDLAGLFGDDRFASRVLGLRGLRLDCSDISHVSNWSNWRIGWRARGSCLDGLSTAAFATLCSCWLRRRILCCGRFLLWFLLFLLFLLRRLRQNRDLARLVLVGHRGRLAEQVDDDHAVINLLNAACDNLAYGKSVSLVAGRTGEPVREWSVRLLLLLAVTTARSFRTTFAAWSLDIAGAGAAIGRDAWSRAILALTTTPPLALGGASTFCTSCSLSFLVVSVVPVGF